MPAERPNPQSLAQIEAAFRAWRQEHPQATLTELEIELDRRLRAARAQLLSEVVGDLPLAKTACPDCGHPLLASDSRSRALITHDDQPLRLTRPYRRCPACGTGLSPLDETLGLAPGSPWLIDGMVRLGACVPFAQVPPLLAHFTGVTVSPATVRRLTEAAGAAQIAIETQAVEQIEQTLPEPPPGPAVQLLSVDGAMVPLVGGAWSEVKTLAIGTVQPDPAEATQVRTEALSYFSRLSEAEAFSRLATLETQRRGTETAGTVVDGAAWCQGFIDHQRPDAVRILDFPHALEHLGAVAQARFGPGTEAAGQWLTQQAQALRHGQEGVVLDRLSALTEDAALPAEVRAVSRATHEYLHHRREQIRYQAFAAAGYPIGSGCIESANKLPVEARLKGSGMHWARAQVNPMLALRGMLHNGRWTEAWPALWDRLRGQGRDRARQRRQARREQPNQVPALPPPEAGEPVTGEQTAPPRPKTIVNGRPTAQHPWRRCSPFPAKP